MAAAAAAAVARAYVLPLIRQVPLWPVAADTAADTAAAAPVCVLRACGFGERKPGTRRRTAVQSSLSGSVFHIVSVLRVLATVAICPKNPHVVVFPRTYGAARYARHTINKENRFITADRRRTARR